MPVPSPTKAEAVANQTNPAEPIITLPEECVCVCMHGCMPKHKHDPNHMAHESRPDTIDNPSSTSREGERERERELAMITGARYQRPRAPPYITGQYYTGSIDYRIGSAIQYRISSSKQLHTVLVLSIFRNTSESVLAHPELVLVHSATTYTFVLTVHSPQR